MTSRSFRRHTALLLGATAILGLGACHREESAEPPAAAPPVNTTVAEPAPAPVEAAPAVRPSAEVVSPDERRRLARAEKDGEAEAQDRPEYEGAHGAATALPSQGDDAPAPTTADAPASTPSSPRPPG